MDEHEEVLHDIARHGWHAAVFESLESAGTGLGYSIGFFQTFGHPEIFIYGLSSDIISRLLVLVSVPIVAGDRFHAGSLIPDIAGQTLTFVEVHREFYERFFQRALSYYGERSFPMLQLVWPDPEGHFPWHPDYDYRYEQPVLGPNVA